MSNETTSVSNELDQGSTSGQEESKDVVAYESHAKLLNQKKQRDKENAELRSQVEKLQEGSLLNEGKKDEVITAQRKKISELEARTAKQENVYGWNIVSSQIESALLDRGVRNPKKALAYARSTMADDIKLLEADENYNIKKEDVDRFADKFLVDNSDMGFVGQVSVSDTNPNNNVLPPTEKPSLESMTEDQLDAALMKSM